MREQKIVVLTWILPTRCPRIASTIVLTAQAHVGACKPIAVVTFVNTSTYFSQCSQHVSSPAWDRFSRFTPGDACMAADPFYPLTFSSSFFYIATKAKAKVTSLPDGFIENPLQCSQRQGSTRKVRFRFPSAQCKRTLTWRTRFTVE